MRSAWLGELGIWLGGGLRLPASLTARIPPAAAPARAPETFVLGNTYDPRRCLRIYFSSRVPDEPRLVIAHVGRHFEVKSTT